MRSGLPILALMALAGSARAQAIINIDASVYCPYSGNWLQVPLGPGTYDLYPLDQAHGGQFTAYNLSSGNVSLCNPAGWGCYEGFYWDYTYFIPPDGFFIGVQGDNCYPLFRTAELAFACNKTATLVLTQATSVHFRIGSGLDCNQNLGGVSLMLVRRCDADFNGDGFLDFFDADAFVAAFESGDPSADFNRDGFLDFFDADAFVEAFEAGC